MHAQMSPLMRNALEAAQRELAREFSGVFSQETISRVLEDSYERIGERPTVGPNFMPIFVKRFARERLEAVAQAEGLVAKTLPEVLFVCVHNSGRSQMAAALCHELSGGHVSVRSAGSRPDREDRPGRNAGDERGRDRRADGVPQAVDRRGRPRRGCRGDARVRGRVSRVSGQALRGLAGRRSGRAADRGRAAHPLRHPPPRDRPARALGVAVAARSDVDAHQEPALEPGRCDHRHPRQPASAASAPGGDRRDRGR